jgi:hypothetical protein
MSDTVWLDRHPGQTVARLDAERDGDGKMLLVGADRFDWVRCPPELGGERSRVRASVTSRCPAHRNHDCVHHHLENGISVAECDQFYWYRSTT